jgi:anti-anti-sigma factor
VSVEDFLAPGQLRTHVVHVNGSAQVLLHGELDLATAPSFWQVASQVNGQISPDAEFVVNLEGLEFLDAAGLGAIVRLRNHLRESGSTLRLEAASPRIRRVFELACLEALLRPREGRAGTESAKPFDEIEARADH